MFNSISGTLTGKTAESVYIETNGIEWEVFVSALSADRFGTAGSTVRVYTWLFNTGGAESFFGFNKG